jgi:hypothetical protein
MATYPPKLDPDFYNLQPQEVAFFKQQTGIDDDELLKQHIIQVQVKAYEVLIIFTYRSYTFSFHCRFIAITVSVISTSPASRLLPCLVISKHSASSKNATGLSCLTLVLAVSSPPSGFSIKRILSFLPSVGTDVRKAVFDGWPIQDIIASDIEKGTQISSIRVILYLYLSGFWEYGHQLFKSTPDTFPIAFIPGDVFDPAFISQRGPFFSMADVEGTVMPPLNTLSSLNPVQGKISAIHISSFFHIFSEDRQLQLAKIVSSLLSPEKGSVIFGQHGTKHVKGLIEHNGATLFCHSSESWIQMWVEDVFGGEDRVKVDAELVSGRGFISISEEEKVCLLKWSVTRL